MIEINPANAILAGEQPYKQKHQQQRCTKTVRQHAAEDRDKDKPGGYQDNCVAEIHTLFFLSVRRLSPMTVDL